MIEVQASTGIKNLKNNKSSLDPFGNSNLPGCNMTPRAWSAVSF